MKKKIFYCILLFLLTFVAYAKTFLVTQTCNLREKPTTSSKIITTIPVHEEIKSNYSEGEWFKTTYMGKTGYVHGSSLRAWSSSSDFDVITFIVILLFIIVIVVIIYSVKYGREKREFENSHILKCSVCGCTDTRFIDMTTTSETSGYSHSYNSSRHISRHTTYKGHDKFYCSKCGSNHFIEKGDWVDANGVICNEEAKKFGLYR